MKKLILILLFTMGVAVFGVAQASPAAPVQGTDYTVLGKSQPVGLPAGKVEVLEFMWYGCPHCSEFDPSIEAWKKKQGPDVVFKRVPVAFRDDFIPHSKMLLALDALGETDKLTPAIFKAIHVDKNYLMTPEVQADFLAKQGVDRKKYMEAYNSFSVASGVKRAAQMASDYKIDGVPTLIVQGKYVTGPSMTNSLDGTLQVVDFLVAQIRAKKM